MREQYSSSLKFDVSNNILQTTLGPRYLECGELTEKMMKNVTNIYYLVL